MLDHALLHHQLAPCSWRSLEFSGPAHRYLSQQQQCYLLQHLCHTLPEECLCLLLPEKIKIIQHFFTLRAPGDELVGVKKAEADSEQRLLSALSSFSKSLTSALGTSIESLGSAQGYIW